MRELLLAAALLGMVGGVQAQKVALVELFTSEGCSSCPPADALLAKLNGMKVEDGTLVVGLSEHVTYWNSLGWRDPFSQEMFTARQRAYGDRFRLQSVYTPQVVINGEREALGSDGRAVARAVTAAGVAGMGVTIDNVALDGKKIALRYTLTGASAGASVWAVVAEDKASSEVLRGENGGHRLTHVAVARTMVRVGDGAAGAKAVQMEVPEKLAGTMGRHVVVFVQAAGQGKVLAVDSREM